MAISPQEFAALNQAAHAYYGTNAPQVPTKKKKDRGLLDFLSTGTSVGGALAGGAAGAALGSAVPVVGTAIGGILGAILGGAGGGAAGQVAENAVMGDKLDNGVASEALMGGATALPFGAALKVGQAGLKLGTGIGKTAASDLIQQAGAKVVPGAIKATGGTVATGSKLGAKLTNKGDMLLGSQANLGKKDIRELGGGRTPEGIISALNQRYGARNIDQIAKVADNVTGANGAYSELAKNAIGNSKGVDLGDIRNVANDLMINLAPNVNNATRQQILDSVKNSVVKANGGARGSLNPLSNPLEAFDVARAWETKAAQLLNKATVTSADQEQAQVYKQLARTVNDRLFSAPGVKEGLQAAKGDAVRSFKQLAANAPNNQQRGIYEALVKEAGGVKDVKQLRSLQSDWVAAQAVNRGVEQGKAGAAQALGGQAQGLGKLVQRPFNLLALPLDAATPRVGSALRKAGQSLEGRAATTASTRSGQALLPLAAREAGARLLTAPGGQQDASALPVDPTLTQDPSLMGGDQTAQDPTAQEPSIGGVTKSQLEAAMTKAALDGKQGAAALDQLKTLYAMLPQDQGANLSSSTARQVAQSANGEATIAQLEQLLNNAGGAQGPVIGAVRGANPFDTNARAYQQLSKGSVAQIAKALGETGALSNSDITTYGQMLPTLSDTPEVAQAKITALKQRLAIARQNTLLYGAGAKQDFGANA